MAFLVLLGTKSFHLRDHEKLPVCFYAAGVDDRMRDRDMVTVTLRRAGSWAARSWLILTAPGVSPGHPGSIYNVVKRCDVQHCGVGHWGHCECVRVLPAVVFS